MRSHFSLLPQPPPCEDLCRRSRTNPSVKTGSRKTSCILWSNLRLDENCSHFPGTAQESPELPVSAHAAPPELWCAAKQSSSQSNQTTSLPVMKTLSLMSHRICAKVFPIKKMTLQKSCLVKEAMCQKGPEQCLKFTAFSGISLIKIQIQQAGGGTYSQ